MIIKAEILKADVADILDLSAEWNTLCDEGPSNEPFLRAEWFAAFARNFEDKLELVTVRRDGRLRAIFPLIPKRCPLHGLPVSKLQAAFNLNSPRFNLIHGADESEKTEVLRAIWTVIKHRRDWTVMEIRLVKKDSWLSSLIEIAEFDSFRTGVWEMDGAPFISLPCGAGSVKNDINEFLKGSKRQLRQQLDRRKRRLSEMGKLELITVDAYTPELLDRFFDLEARGWKGRKGTAVVHDPRVVKLHHEVSKDASNRKALHAYELRLDGRTIAMIISVRYGRTMFYWKTSYDEEYSKFSPGNVLFKMFVADCLDRGIEEIDLLSPSTANKRHWSSGEREHVAYYFFKPGLIGSFFWFWKFKVITGLRKWKIEAPLTLKKLVPIGSQK